MRLQQQVGLRANAVCLQSARNDEAPRIHAESKNAGQTHDISKWKLNWQLEVALRTSSTPADNKLQMGLSSWTNAQAAHISGGTQVKKTPARETCRDDTNHQFQMPSQNCSTETAT